MEFEFDTEYITCFMSTWLDLRNIGSAPWRRSTLMHYEVALASSSSSFFPFSNIAIMNYDKLMLNQMMCTTLAKNNL